MTTVLQIRGAGPADAAAIRLLWEQLQAAERTMHHNRDVPSAVSEPHLDALRRHLAQNDGFELVAELNGSIVGYLAAFVAEGDLYLIASDRRFGYVAELVVDAGHRRAGIAGRLLAAAEHRFRVQGFAQMQIGALAGNTEARGLYEARGYRTYLVVYECRFDGLAASRPEK